MSAVAIVAAWCGIVAVLGTVAGYAVDKWGWRIW